MTYANRLRWACCRTATPITRTSSQPLIWRQATSSPGSRVIRSLSTSPRFLSSSGGSSSNRFQGAVRDETQAQQEDGEHLSPWKKQRKNDLEEALSAEEPLFTEAYPRVGTKDGGVERKSVPEFMRDFSERLADEEMNLMGRVRAKRVAGKGLMFLDIVNEFQKVQVMLSKKAVRTVAQGNANRFELFRNLIQVGDHISVKGVATRTSQGEPTLKAVELPELLSPAMEQIPDELTDPKTKMHHRHVDMLVNREVTDVLRLRAEVTRFMREHLYAKRFLEFQTPILSQNAGGAVARPFVTTATEFRDKHLAMRIAPELWLKRLVVGGVDRVFEIGPAFRNEGIDATHNPEFTMCEFYSAYSNLADLMAETEEILAGLAERTAHLIATELTALPTLDAERFTSRPFKRLEFVPALEDALGFRMPRLSSETALPELLVALKLAGVDVPGEVPSSLPKLLDRLAAMYLEPQSFERPVFITHHPACMSPLSKSFVCPATYQLVSARAELFVGGRELANMYEEENDPEEQARKLAAHRNLVNKPDGTVALREDASEPEPELEDEDSGAEQSRLFGGIETDVDGETSPLDQSFIRALDYGLPPTGGWGCGVERLVMLFSGAKRISDCLSFGTLKNVVGLSAELEDERRLKRDDQEKP